MLDHYCPWLDNGDLCVCVWFFLSIYAFSQFFPMNTEWIRGKYKGIQKVLGLISSKNQICFSGSH